MIRKNLLLVVLLLAPLALFLSAEAYAGTGFTELPLSGGTGIVTGNIHTFPNEVFVLANKNDGASFTTCGLNDILVPIANMEVSFTTRTSGLVQVLFCGNVVNDATSNQVDVIAMIDPPSLNICQPGNIRWEEGDDAGGSNCFSWICEVTNDRDCGRHGNSWCWTPHTIQMQCSTPGDTNDSHFNSRILKVFYNKYFQESADPPPPPPL